jgi:phage recombination protein Bet
MIMTTSTALAIHQAAELSTAPSDFGEDHKRIVREAFAPTATQAEFEVLWLGAKSRGLDPVRRQIHFVKRFDKARNADVWSSQVSIDGFRAIAESTRLYDGQDEPINDFDKNGGIVCARVSVYRKDIGRAFVGVARWPEFAQFKSSGGLLYMWEKMPCHMLGKCAEALALRKAFPEKLAGLYVPEEMPQDDAPPPRTVNLTSREVTPATNAEPMTHVRVDGDALFEAARVDALLGLLAAAREEGQGPAAEQAFAGRVGVLLGMANKEGVAVLRQIAKDSQIDPASPPGKTIRRALDVAVERLLTTPVPA